jgi:aminoglycoside 6'-N-acetyltransferase I
MDLIIGDLAAEDTATIEQVAAILVAAFAEQYSDAWPDMRSALDEVRESLEPGRISRVARDAGGAVLGWVGAIPQYRGRVCELHPLAVDPARQGQGIGRALVRDLEIQARARGAGVVLLGTDDVRGLTTLSHVDLYQDLWEHVRQIRPLGRHPYLFYQKLGYSIVGVVPDANGSGKPDILMAKSLLHS